MLVREMSRSECEELAGAIGFRSPCLRPRQSAIHSTDVLCFRTGPYIWFCHDGAEDRMDALESSGVCGGGRSSEP